MDARAQQRLYVLTNVPAGELTADEAARVPGASGAQRTAARLKLLTLAHTPALVPPPPRGGS